MGTLDALAAAGVSREKVLVDLPRDQWPQTGTRMDWEPFTRILDRAVQELGGLKAFEEVMASGSYGFSALTRLVQLCVEPVDLYRVLQIILAPSLFNNIAMGFHVEEPGRVRVTTSIARPYRGSLPWQHASLGLLRVAPRHLGLPDAQVSAQFDERDGTFVVTLPRARTLGARLRELRQRPEIAVIFDEFEERNAQLAVLRESTPPPPPPPSTHDGLIARLGPALLEARGTTELATAVADAVQGHFGAAHVSLWLRDPVSNTRRKLAQRGGDDGTSYLSRPLSVGGLELGELRLSHPARDGVDTEALDALVPWIGIALERVVNAQASMLGALESVPSPLFLAAPDGSIVFSTGSARRALQEQPDLARRVRDVVVGNGEHDGLRVVAAADQPLQRYRVVLLLGGPVPHAERIEQRAQEWKLTPRQVTVLHHVLSGLSNKEIAALLDIGQATVEVHITQLLKKAGVSSRTALMARFFAG